MPATLGEARAQIQAGLAGSSNPAFAGARVDTVDDALVVVPGASVPALGFTFAGDGADELLLSASAQFVNIGGYQPGVGLSKSAQVAGTLGSDGSPPSNAAQITGSRAAKSGMYALEDADIFNILCMPGTTAVAALGEAIVYAEERRAMVIVDIDPNIDALDEARDWVDDPANSSLKSTNAVAYFPRVRVADPLQNGRLRSFSNSGLMAGLWARTDGQRGIWKAPAGIDAVLRGVQALDYVLSDPENGVLNPLGVNCLRTFPVYGTVSWGARTLFGADARASEWEIHPGASHRALHRGEPLSRDAIRGVRAERRTAVGADPPRRRVLHEQPVPTRRLPGCVTARGVLREVRFHHHDPGRHRPWNRQHPRGLRASEASGIRDHFDPADRRPGPGIRRGATNHGRIQRQCSAL